MKKLNERLNVTTSDAPHYAIALDIEQKINYLDTLIMYCDDNNLDAQSLEDEEFSNAANLLESLCKTAKNDGNHKVYFWIDAE